MFKIKTKNFQGFSLIEILISISIFIILLMGIYSLVQLSLRISQDNKFNSEAVNLANQKIEEIHNLSYDKVGTVNGVPAGVIPEQEIIKKSIDYKITTAIIYYDDPYDGSLLAGDDLVFTDYKLVSLRVSWIGRNGINDLVFFTKVIPNTEESPSGYGLLKLSVVDANGSPLSSVNISVKNSKISPIINANYLSDQNGFLVLPVPPSLEGYEVSVAKDGYSQAKTYARTISNPNPTKPNYSVFAGQKTEDSFSIDRLANITFKTILSRHLQNFKLSRTQTDRFRSKPRVEFVTGSSAFSIWQSQTGTGPFSVYWQKFSNNGDLSWSNEKLISSGYNPDLVKLNDSKVAATWQKNSASNNDVYFQLFNNEGQSLGTAKLAHSFVSGDQINPRFAKHKNQDQATTTIVWQDNRNGNWDVYAQVFNDKGVLLLNSDLDLDNNILNDEFPSVVALGNDNFLAAWIRNDSSDSSKNQIVIQKFSASGERFWSEGKLINNSETIKSNLEISVGEQGEVYLTYIEGNQPSSVVLEKYNEEGQLLWQKKVNQKRIVNHVSSPSIASNDQSVVISWVEKIENYNEVYCQKFDNMGGELWDEDLRLNSTLNQSGQDQPFLGISSNGVLSAVWRDNRDNNSNIYAVMFNDFPLGSSAANVPIVVTGTKKIGENPVIYKVNSTYQTDANGNLVLPLEWDTPGYTVKLNSGYSGILKASEPELPFVVQPGESKTLILNIQ